MFRLSVILSPLCSVMLTAMVIKTSCASADTISFVWNDYCPYTCDADKTGGQEGFAMEVVKAIFQDSGHEAVFTRIGSWNRALHMVGIGAYDAIVFTYYSPDMKQSFLLPDEFVIRITSTAFVKLKNNPWRMKNIESLDGLSQIGVYRNSVWVDERFGKYKSRHEDKFTPLHGQNVFPRAIQMLRLGRIDAWVDSEHVIDFYIYRTRAADLSVERYQSDTELIGGPIFSLKKPNSQKYREVFEEGIRRLKLSGGYYEIVAGYGLKNIYPPVEDKPKR